VHPHSGVITYVEEFIIDVQLSKFNLSKIKTLFILLRFSNSLLVIISYFLNIKLI